MTTTSEDLIPRLRQLAADWNVQKLVSWDQQANDGDIREFTRQVNQVEYLCTEAASACEALIRERQQERSAEVGRLADYAAAAALVVELRVERDRLKAKLDVALDGLKLFAETHDSGARCVERCSCRGDLARAALAKLKEMP